MSDRAIHEAALRAVLRDQLRREAEASVALDLDGDVHTCSEQCANPACVARREREAQA
jgi:hypothetical protein